MTARAMLAAVLGLAVASGAIAARAGSHGHAEPEPEPAAEASSDTPPAPIPQVSREPLELVRTLRSIQDQVAQGSVTAHEAQRRFLARMNEDMRNFPSELWQDPVNVRAAIGFVLAGGEPRTLKDIMSQSSGEHADEALLKAAVAFGEGRMGDAMQFFEKVDSRSLEPYLGALVSLVYGTLLAKKDVPKAIARFDEARLLAPGTLIEESALRLEILLVAREGKLEKFDRLASQYWRRFGKSIYAANFRRQLFTGVAKQDFAGRAEWISRTEKELERLPAKDRRDAYIAMAEEATLGGNVEIARFAAENAGRLAQPGSVLRERAKLFEAASLILGEDYEKGDELLATLAEIKLRASDKDILKAARGLSRNVRRWADTGEPTSDPPLASVSRAESLIAEADTLLTESMP